MRDSNVGGSNLSSVGRPRWAFHMYTRAILFVNVFSVVNTVRAWHATGGVRCPRLRVPEELCFGGPGVRGEGDDHRHGQRQDRGKYS